MEVSIRAQIYDLGRTLYITNVNMNILPKDYQNFLDWTTKNKIDKVCDPNSNVQLYIHWMSDDWQNIDVCCKNSNYWGYRKQDIKMPEWLKPYINDLQFTPNIVNSNPFKEFIFHEDIEDEVSLSNVYNVFPGLVWCVTKCKTLYMGKTWYILYHHDTIIGYCYQN